MNEVKMDGYCGLYCGGCDIYRLSEKARKSGGKATWNEMPERFNGILAKADVVCRGCKSGTLFAGCGACPILKCAKKKGVESCALCRKYPCFYFTLMNIVVKWRKLDKKLPHTAARKPNLEYIKKNGLNDFLSEQEKLWKCPQCGSPLSWYLERCGSCGKGNERSYGDGNQSI